MPGVNFHHAWEAAVEGEVAGLALAPVGGHCFVGTSTGQLIFYGPDGAPLWQSSLPGPVIDVRCAGGGEYAVALTATRELAAFDGSGRLIWIKELPFMAACFDLRAGSNLIVVGNRYGIYRYITISGRIMSGGRLEHAIDFIRFAPGGGACALAAEDGHVSLLTRRRRVRWTVFLHRMIIGLDVANRAHFIIAPSRNQGIVAIDEDGQGVGVYELKELILTAAVDDPGRLIVLIDHNGNLIVLDREAKLLFLKPCFRGTAPTGEQATLSLKTRATLLSVNSDGTRLAVAGSGGVVQCYKRSDAEVAASEFVEVQVKDGKLHRGDDTPVRFLEV